MYGARNPTYTADVDGLVNGDNVDDDEFTDLVFDGPPASADVGRYAIKPSGAINPNYDIAYANGTQTITPAPLVIRPDDVVVASGSAPRYTWRGDGWVNGDADATLATPPHREPACSATVAGAAASADTAPGEYPDAVRCLGAVNANYDISYARASLRVDPVISLDARGLPRSAARRAYVDGLPVALPLVARDVRFGSRHATGSRRSCSTAGGRRTSRQHLASTDRSRTTSTSRRASSRCDGCSGRPRGLTASAPARRPGSRIAGSTSRA